MWTEQAIEALKQLALEGKSASWIAEALGAPSRNAVIGKANRIGIKLNGIGGRHSAGMEIGPGPERPTPAQIKLYFDGQTSRAPIGHSHRAQSVTPALSHRGRTASGKRSRNATISRERTQMFASAEVGEMRRIAFEDIREVECRWPLGDPTETDFAYCGLQVANGHAYCAGHCRLAYRQPNSQGATPNTSRPRDDARAQFPAWQRAQYHTGLARL
jgi:GcrA cell cycle regulator